MRFSLLITFLYLNALTYAQNNPGFVFGKVSMEDLLRNKCETDTSTEAELLYDKEDIGFFFDHTDAINIKITYSGRLKIYKKSGLDRGTLKLSCQRKGGHEESIEDIKGITFNLENGARVSSSITTASIFKDRTSDYESITKISFPNVKVGSIVDYTYTRIIPLKVKVAPSAWSFQSRIPYKWSEVSMVIPSMFVYKLFYKGYLPLAINEKKDTTMSFGNDVVKATKLRMAVKEAPAFIREEYISSSKDCIARLTFELASYSWPGSGEETKFSETWDDINKLLSEHRNFGERIDENSFLEGIANTFKSIADTTEKIKAAFDFVSKTIKWNGHLDVLTTESLENVFKNRLGSSAQINMILVGLLRQLNVDANPAIISTKSNGEINEEFPLLDNFNCTIAHVKIGGWNVLMDASDKFSKPDMLPNPSLCGKAFVIKKKKGELITWEPKEKRRTLHVIDYEILPEANEIKGKHSLMGGGYAALEVRNVIERTGEAEFIKGLKKLNQNWQLANIKIENKDNNNSPVKITYDFSFPNLSENPSQFFFNPLASFRHSENPFKDDIRIYPVDFWLPEEEVVIASIKIPKGYKVKEKPQSILFTLPDKSAKFSYLVEEENDLLKIKSQVSILKSLFTVKEYPLIKELFNKIVEKQSGVIILEKI